MVDGYWPYACAAKHTQLRHYLDSLLSLNPKLCMCPAPADTLFAAHKSRYHSYLETAFEKRVVIPSVYLPPCASIDEVKEALADLTQRVATANGLVLKRGLSGSGYHVEYINKPSLALTARQIYNVLNGAHAKGVPTMWLLQPKLTEFAERHELKLYFDVHGQLIHAYANMFLPKLAPINDQEANAVVEVIELRRDEPRLWLAHDVDVALSLALEVRRAVLRMAPSLAPLMRLDLIRTKEWGFVVNEVEHFGGTWLQLQRTTSATALPRIAASVEHWARVAGRRKFELSEK